MFLYERMHVNSITCALRLAPNIDKVMIAEFLRLYTYAYAFSISIYRRNVQRDACTRVENERLKREVRVSILLQPFI